MRKTSDQLNMRNIWLISLVAACGGLLFGYDWVVIGGAKPFYEAYFNITNASLSGWAMSSALIGCMVGAFIAGTVSDKYGRKRPLILAALLFVISAWGTAAADSFNAFVVFRIIGGVGIGLASALSPMYIAEIAPADKRGKFVAINQLTIVIGVLAAQIINLLIAEPVASNAAQADILQSWNGQMGWRYMFGAELVPAFAFLLLMFVVPESPRWLVKMGMVDKAKATLLRIGSESYASRTVQEIESTLSAETRSLPFSALFKPDVKPILVIGVVLAAFQQWCGINVIFNYAQEIFASAGFDINDTLKSIVATGLINLVFTILAIPFVDKIGRRKLMIIGSAGLTVIYGLMSAAYAYGMLGLPVLMLVLIAISIYALTLAPVTWVLLSEMFPNKVRGTAMSVSTLALWVACFALTYTFPLLNAGLGASGSFLLYGVICACGFVFIYKRVPETKGRSLEELEKILVTREVAVGKEVNA
ncbi:MULTISPECIES: sugar porter family MFS transporter [Vibrio]|uniref:sugar porter family MFS transporter n=1 Tax=Vibrio TaxID=662 RepID=UPI0002EB6488|nr:MULTISPECIES: sugar porter family MFS transporter [Vibrio]EKO3808657.1 sugar porter family MFS transporter [Vibrio harveyi]EKO3836573.1 sugar porter family MFS transporter [Vibrio harveyi]ELE7134376.1 sugar porter family MFS transporter [Vibrio harveyi]MDA0132521.1 sugar porter family MFS transporter [Vibrio sp. NFR]HDM8201314.1 sugar porter family MFS transporter [Vibrio harveyi]